MAVSVNISHDDPFMPLDGQNDDWIQPEAGRFASTHWSMVLQAGHSSLPGGKESLEQLCRVYWYPLYAFIRRRGYSVHDAQDLTQGFMARLLEKKYIGLADPKRGKFRSFLLKSLQHYMTDEWSKQQSQKRGDRQTVVDFNPEHAEMRYRAEPATELAPDVIFEKRWAVTVLEQVLDRLRAEYDTDGKAELFEALKNSLWGAEDPPTGAELAAQLSLSKGAVKVAAHRLRSRFRQLLRAEIAQTVASPNEVDDELRSLMKALSR